MTRHMLRGLQKVAVVFCNSLTTRDQLEQYGIVDPQRIVVAPLGCAVEFSPEPGQHDELKTVLPQWEGTPFVLHVGSCIPRKRIDVLLEVYAAIRRRNSDVCLVQVGGSWTPEQRDQIRRLGISAYVSQLNGLSRQDLAAVYRGATLLLQPSEAEGFGLPVVEALACGTIVVASDIPVMREVGGDAIVRCPVGDVAAWAEASCQLVNHPESAPALETRLRQAGQFTWARHVRTVVDTYQQLL